jgi:uncharacterized protein (UPF0248 family)
MDQGKQLNKKIIHSPIIPVHRILHVRMKVNNGNSGIEDFIHRRNHLQTKIQMDLVLLPKYLG